MPACDTYRVQLPVSGRPVTVFGGDGAALRHVTALQQIGAFVTVVAPQVAATVVDLDERGLLTWRDRKFLEPDLDDPWLVVAATGEEQLDRRIADACEARRLWCLIAEQQRDDAAVGGPPDRGGARAGAPPGARSGRVTLVGGGPGDPGLLTVAGHEALRDADVVVTDRLAPLGALTDLASDTFVVDVGKVPRGRATAQEEINRLLVEHARAGRNVVRLKGGDSFLFGRGGEELQACVAADVEVRVVPGVSSALAVPAAAGIPVTHRGLNQGFAVVSGHVPPDDPRSTVDYAALARSGTSLVLLMAVETLPAITRALIDGGLPAGTAATTIADGTLASQQVVRATLGDIAESVTDAGITPPAITVIGAVAGFDPAGRRPG